MPNLIEFSLNGTARLGRHQRSQFDAKFDFIQSLQYMRHGRQGSIPQLPQDTRARRVRRVYVIKII